MSSAAVAQGNNDQTVVLQLPSFDSRRCAVSKPLHLRSGHFQPII